MKRIYLFITASIVLIGGFYIKNQIDIGSKSELLPRDINSLSERERGAYFFHGDAFGGLSFGALQTHAIPWKLTAAALVLDAKSKNPSIEINQEEISKIFEQFGFLSNVQIANFPSNKTSIKSELPNGMNYGYLVGVQVANIGCASCHSGVSYDKNGYPDTHKMWLGTPNTSLNIEAYTQAVYFAYLNNINNKDKLLASVKSIYPETNNFEMFMLRYFVVPQIEKRMEQIGKSGRALPFPSGGPGNTNGVAALKLMMKLPMDGDGKEEVGITSIPDLADRAMRSSMLYDGAYASQNTNRQYAISSDNIDKKHISKLAIITSFFSVPSMGVSPNVTYHNYNKVMDVYSYLAEYRAPKFPAQIDMSAAQKGRLIYEAKCATCHGKYDDNLSNPKLLQFPNWIGNVGTDDRRAHSFNQVTADKVNSTIYKKDLIATSSNKYVGTPLSGIWQSAPYIHNGSVPTMFDLLNPKTRPSQFMIGGHALDYEKLGLKIDANGNYPKDYKPWSKAELYDTKQLGHSNFGHNYGEELSQMDKKALIEYLKLL